MNLIELALIFGRLLQYVGAMVVCGSSLLFAYALPDEMATLQVERRWARGLLIGAAALLAIASLLSIALQASLFSDSFATGFTADALSSVVSFMGLGKAALVRAAVAVLAGILLLALPAKRSLWLWTAALGAGGAASLAWMGHGAATQGAFGWLHLSSDILHAVAAAVWLGALAGFVLLTTCRSRAREQDVALHAALKTFSRFGTAAVVTLVLTGLINGWILVGPDHFISLLASPYGGLLALKLLLFLLMLGFALANRFRLTPGLERALASIERRDIGALRWSIALESALGLAILVLVAWLGTLAPPMSGG